MGQTSRGRGRTVAARSHSRVPTVRCEGARSVTKARVRVEAIWLAVTVGATTIAVTLVLQLWRASPRVPMYNSSDVGFTGTLVKTVLRHGWYLDNPDLGFPDAWDMRDFPKAGDVWHFGALRLFAVGSRDWGLATNTFYLASFLAVAISAYIALRWLDVRPPFAAGGAVLTSILPYHFARNEQHLMLSNYAVVPLLVALAVAQLGDEPWFTLSRWRTRRGLGALAIVVLVGGTGLYYAAFGVAILVLTGAIAAVARKSAAPILAAAVLAGIVVLMLALQLIPSFVRTAQDGRNDAVAHRTFYESELYSLRPAAMLLPIPGHRIAPLGSAAETYSESRTPSEPGQAMGIIATVGLLGMLIAAAAALLRGRGMSDARDRGLALVAVVAIGLGVTAG